MSQIVNFPSENTHYLNLITKKQSRSISPKSNNDPEVDTQETNSKSQKGKEEKEESKEVLNCNNNEDETNQTGRGVAHSAQTIKSIFLN